VESVHVIPDLKHREDTSGSGRWVWRHARELRLHRLDLLAIFLRTGLSHPSRVEFNVERLRLVDLPEIAGLWRSIWRWLRVGSMPDESILREKAREAIRSGMLPVGKPDRTFGGQGSGVTCAICGDQVKRDQLELEIDRHGVMPGLDRYHLHVRCFAAWELERTKVDSTSI